MKRILSICLIVVMCACFSACSKEVPKNDEGFLLNFSKGLEERWKISNSLPTTYSSNSEYKESIKRCIDAEMNTIGDLDEYTFEDITLESYAHEYVSALHSQLEGISYYGADDAMYKKLYTEEGYNKRAIMIVKLDNEYGVHVSQQYENTKDEFLAKGNLLIREATMLNEMQDIITEDITLEALGGRNYEILVTNTTEYDLSGSRIYLNLYDDDGILVDTVQNYFESWKSGSKNRASIYANPEFSSAEMSIVYYSKQTNSNISTEFVPIKYVNNMHIDIQVTTVLPAQFSDKWYTKCDVTGFSYDISSWNAGKANVKIEISGVKTYDSRGKNYSRRCEVAWKLYNVYGVLMDSGTFYSSASIVGEAFTSCSSSVNGLPVGKYTLELMNVT